MRRSMIHLARGVAIFDAHTRLAHLETGTPLLAALGATAVTRHMNKPSVDCIVIDA